MDKNDFELLQVNDSSFPIGSYTLSWGAETFVQQKIIFDFQTAFSYLKNEVKSNFLTNELLPVRLAYEYAMNDEWSEVFKIDEIYNASKNAKEIREGSKKTAARFLKTVSLWQNVATKIRNLSAISHFSVMYGSYCSVRNIEESKVLKSFLYSQVSSRVITLVKLIPLSQSDGQKILHALFDDFPSIIDCVMNLSEKDLCRSGPLSEIRAMQHEFLYTRLYMS